MTAGLPSRPALLVIAVLTGVAATVVCEAVVAAGASVLWIIIGAITGTVLAILVSHPYRVLGLLPPALTAGAAVAAISGSTTDSPHWLLYLLAGVAGCTAVAQDIYHNRFGQHLHWNPGSASLLVFVVTLLTWRSTLADSLRWTRPTDYLAAAAILFGVAAVVAWLYLFRPFIELAAEPVVWLMYAIRGAGPGLAAVPRRGPCLVVANHACWFDPLFLAKVLPRPVTPMMTSRFYDLPVIRWFMRRFGVIRVPEKAMKHDPVEVHEAVAALDRGACVVVFPEGYLRRAEDRPLRRFGRGVWQILQSRPDTPVFACWIEGGWGSFCSYKSGPPTKNKRPDFRRPVAVAVDGPVGVDADTLKDHLATRVYLMNRVLAARAFLGLPELPPVVLPAQDEPEAGPQPA
jgi:1-acyl-sn-glycerol-3-phosphate acyltransferase